MAKFWEKFRSAVGHFRGRFSTFVAESDDDLANCLAVRFEATGEAARRDLDPLDRNSTIIGCRDSATGLVVGTLAVTPGPYLVSRPDLAKTYLLDRFPPSLHGHVAAVSRLAVRRSAHSHLPSFLLLQASYSLLLEREAVVACMVCEPNIYPFYRRLGFRPLGRIHRLPHGGYQLPLFLVAHDFDHLHRVDSPLIKAARQKGFPWRSEGIDWYHEHVAALDPSGVGFAVASDSMYGDMNAAVLDGISEAGREELMRNGIVLTYEPGEAVAVHGGSDRSMGFILAGALEVRQGDTVLCVMGAGDLFGELAFILGIPRTADLIAAVPNTKVISLSLGAVERLQNKDDEIRFWRNISEILAMRLAGASLSDPS